VPVPPIDKAQNNDVQVAAPNQADVLSSPEAAKIRKQIDYANQFDDDGSQRSKPVVEMTKGERDAVILFLLRVKKM